MLNRLISSLGVRGKIILLLALFFIPLSLLAFTNLSLIHDRLRVTKSELAGVSEIKPIFEDALDEGTESVILTMQEKIYKIATDSTLILDPYFESYYLQDIITSQLPEIVEHLARGSNPNASQIERTENAGILRLHILPKFYYVINQAKISLAKSELNHSDLISSIDEIISRKAIVESSLQKAIGGSVADYNSARNTLKDIASKVSKELEHILTERAESLTRQKKIAWSVTIGTLFILILLSWSIVCNITGRLSLLFKATSKAAQSGDLSQRVEEEGRDEIFQLSQSFNTMIDSLRGMVTKVVHSGSLISTSTAEIAAVSKQQQATSSEIAATTTQIEATSKQIASTSEQLSKSMHEVQETASKTAQLATDGQSELEHMKYTMHSITEACAGISGKLETLNQRASKIGDVVITISKVADQTNLLSLNAAIEAEKAGEFGHGFAVVAREIRRLADQTAISTLDIEQMVKEIQSAVAAGVMGMEKFSNEVRRGATEVEGTSSQLSTIINQIQTLSPTFQSVSEGMQSQVIGAKQISEGLSQLSTAARQTADSLSQSNYSIEQLHQATVLLEQEVAKFKLEESN